MKATIVKINEKSILVAVSKGLTLGGGQIGYCGKPQEDLEIGQDISKAFFAEGEPVRSEMIDEHGEPMTANNGEVLHKWVWL